MHEMLTIVTQDESPRNVVCLSVRLSVMHLHPVKVAEWMVVLFGINTLVSKGTFY